MHSYHVTSLETGAEMLCIDGRFNRAHVTQDGYRCGNGDRRTVGGMNRMIDRVVNKGWNQLIGPNVFQYVWSVETLKILVDIAVVGAKVRLPLTLKIDITEVIARRSRQGREIRHIVAIGESDARKTAACRILHERRDAVTV